MACAKSVFSPKHNLQFLQATTYLGIGSNLGKRRENLRQAQLFLEQKAGNIVKVSSVYETEAWGIEAQPAFLNQVLALRTTLPPEELLEVILQIERDMGRMRTIKWGERLIDIDILFYNDQILQTEKLRIPHPFVQDRNFVLAPLAEIAADFVHPILDLSIIEILNNSKDILSVKILSE